MKTMKILLAGAMLAGTVGLAGPAAAQRVTIGPDGPGVDFRTREQRRRDMQMERRDDYYRQQRFGDRDRRDYRRGYDY